MGGDFVAPRRGPPLQNGLPPLAGGYAARADRRRCAIVKGVKNGVFHLPFWQ
jgi:hypothetical protein